MLLAYSGAALALVILAPKVRAVGEAGSEPDREDERHHRQLEGEEQESPLFACLASV
jgi:hypothetical protein